MLTHRDNISLSFRELLLKGSKCILYARNTDMPHSNSSPHLDKKGNMAVGCTVSHLPVLYISWANYCLSGPGVFPNSDKLLQLYLCLKVRKSIKVIKVNKVIKGKIINCICTKHLI